MTRYFKPENILIRRILILLLIYTILRFAFLYFNRTFIAFPSVHFLLLDFVQALRFDLFNIVMVNAFFILLHIFSFGFFVQRWFQKLLKCIFYLINLPFILIHILNIFLKDQKLLSSFDLMQEIRSGELVAKLSALNFLETFVISILFVLVLLTMELLYRIVPMKFATEPRSRRQWIFRIISMFAGLPLFFLTAGENGFLSKRHGNQQKISIHSLSALEGKKKAVHGCAWKTESNLSSTPSPAREK